MKQHLIPVEKFKEPIKFADDQLKIFWLPDEVKVEKDVQDILVNFTEKVEE
jgi:ribonucleotide reductase beta subunit family protein with ferritin-like domain